MSYENPWMYEGKIFNFTDVEDNVGFVYRITNLITDKQYIGRKYFFSHRKPRGKKRKVTAESDWKNYYGSSKELKEEITILGKINYKREILSLHKTEGKTNYEETKQLFLHNVLTEKFENGTEKYYNSQILNRYFKKDYFNYL